MGWDDQPPPEVSGEKKSTWDDAPPPELRSKKASSKAAPVTQNESEPTTSQWLKEKGLDSLGVMGKLAGAIRNQTTGPATALILQALSRKKVADITGGMADSANLTNLKQFPSNAEMFKTAGIANPSLSDVVPGYAPKGKGAHWYSPEKGGMLDPSVAGALQVVTDPAMYLGLGEAKLAAEGLTSAAKALGMVNDVTNPLSMITKKVGQGAYEAPLLPLKNQGARYGKTSIPDTLYRGGVKTPADLPQAAQGVVDELMAKRDALLEQAGSAGGKAYMEEAVAPIRQRVAEIRESRDPKLLPLADKLERDADAYISAEKGTPSIPGEPPSTTVVDSPILDETGKPFQKEITNPGTPDIPGIPPKAISPAEASGYKTSIYKTQPKGAYANAVSSDAETELDSLLARGQLDASQNAVRRSLGDKAADQVEELNRQAGGLLTTRKAQETISDTAARQKKALTEINPADVITGMAGLAGGGSVGHPLEGLAAGVALKKLASALNQSKMPAGYYLRKTGATTALDRLNELSTEKRSQNGKK